MRALFFSREFLAYFAARESNWLAIAIVDVAIGWQAYALTHSALAIGLVGLIWFVPQLLLAIPAGVFADRIDRRTICIAVTLLNLACSISYIVLAMRGVESVVAWYIAFAVQGISYALGAPAYRSILAQIVSGEAYIRASALTSSVGELVSIAGPGLGGLLIALSLQSAFIVAAAAQVLAVIAFVLLTPRAPQPRDRTQRKRDIALGGFRYIWQNKLVLGAISLDLFAVLFGGATALLPIYATQILHVGAAGFGFLRAAPAVGASLVALLLTRRPIVRNGGRWLFFCVAGFGAATVIFGLSKLFWLSLVMLAIAGGCDEVSVVIRTTLVQLRTPDAMRGRVSAVENIFIGASNELGAFESGTLAAFIGAVPSVVLGGVATLAVIALWTALFPALRKFDRLTG